MISNRESLTCSVRVYESVRRGLVKVYARLEEGREYGVHWGLEKPDSQESGTGWVKVDHRAAMVNFRSMWNQAVIATDEKFGRELTNFLRTVEDWAAGFAIPTEIETYVDSCIAKERVFRKKEFFNGLPCGTPPNQARKAFDAYLHQLPSGKKPFPETKKSSSVHTASHPQVSPKRKAPKPKTKGDQPRRIWVHFFQGGAPGLGKRA